MQHSRKSVVMLSEGTRPVATMTEGMLEQYDQLDCSQADHVMHFNARHDSNHPYCNQMTESAAVQQL